MVLIRPLKFRGETIDRWLSDDNEYKNAPIPQRRLPKKIRMDGHGRYRCHACNHSWTSHEASVNFDVKKAHHYADIRVDHVFAQKCSECRTRKCLPAFREDEWTRMVERLCRRIANWTERPPRQTGREGGPKPHHADRCEACGWGTTPLRSHVGGRG